MTRFSMLRKYLHHCKIGGKKIRFFSQSTSHTGSQLSSSSLASSSQTPVALIFDTETTGLVNHKAPPTDPSQPHLVQLGMVLVDTKDWSFKSRTNLLVQLPPDDSHAVIEPRAQETHGITKDDLDRFGVSAEVASALFYQACQSADMIVAHNMSFDKTVMDATLHRSGIVFANKNQDRTNNRGLNQTGSILDDVFLPGRQFICTKDESTDVLKLPGRFNNSYKWPTLAEAYHYFTNGKEMENAHDALADTEACCEVFRALVERDIIQLPKVHGDDKQETKVCHPLQFLKHNNSTSSSTASTWQNEVASQQQEQRTYSSTQKPFLKSSPFSLLTPTTTTAVTSVQHSDYLHIDKKDGYVAVTGRGTYAHKNNLRNLGGIWVPTSKAWNFDMKLAAVVEKYVLDAITKKEVRN